jgi:branched-chain amino acid transport system permease protein
VLQLCVAGLAPGAAYAILGCCVVLLFQTTGVLNFAQAVFGAFGAYTAALGYERGLTTLSAAGLGLLTGAGLAILAGLLITRLFQEHSVATRATAMIAMTVGLLTLGLRLFGDVPRSVAPVTPPGTFRLAGVTVGSSTVAVLGAGVLLVVAAVTVLRRTRLGAMLRAVSARPVTAELLGVPVRRLAVGMWAVTGALATTAMLLIAPTRSDDFRTQGMLILPALSAALLGAFRSLPWTLAGGLLLGVLQSVSVWWTSLSRYQAVLPFVLVIVVLLWSQRKQVWDEAR